LINEKTGKVEEFQNSFSGGMNLIENDTAIAPNQYRDAFNVFNRYGKLEPFLDAEEVHSDTVGIKQGIYGFGEFIIVFCAGKAYFKHYTKQNLTLIPSFAMSETVDRLYAEFVPSSNLNLERTLTTADQVNKGVDIGSTKVSPTPAAMVVNDGINQPRIIYYDIPSNSVLSRETKKYSEWNVTTTANAREYVPIGLDMLYHDGILFMVSPDRKRLYRSVTGRPLDFVVNVDPAGDKVSTGTDPETDGGAKSSDYAVGFDQITSLTASTNDTILIGTNTPQSYSIQIDRTRTVWGEPTFNRVGRFTGSPINSFSVTDVLGETVFITGEGVIGFNSAQEQQVESNNTIFSLNISSAFKDTTQISSQSCVGVFNDFVFFSMNSIYGPVFGVYDKLKGQWVSFYSSGGIRAKQFVSLVPNARELFAITWDNKIYKYFSSANFTSARVNTKAYNSENPRMEQKLDMLNLVFSGAYSSVVEVEPFVDEVSSGIRTKTTNTKSLVNITFDLNSRPLNGFKVAYSISWTSGRHLTHLYHCGSILHFQQSTNQASQFTSTK